MNYKITKIDAAVDQLDWAIKLFLEKSAYVSAMTLASAAEDIIGGALKGSSGFLKVKEPPKGKAELLGSGLSNPYFDEETSWVTYLKDMRDEETAEIDLETEAIQYLVRGITSLFAYDQSLSSESPRFIEWLNKNKPEILNDLEFLK